MRASYPLVALLVLASCGRAPVDEKKSPPARPSTAASVVAASASASASASAAAPSMPTGSAIVGPRDVDLAVYFSAPVTAAQTAKAKTAVEKGAGGVRVVTSPEDARPLIIVLAPGIEDLAPPNEEQLGYFGRGLTPEQAKAVPASKGVIVTSWQLTEDPTFSRIRAAYGFVFDLAKQGGGFVWDENTRQLFSVDEWKRTRLDGWEGDLPNVASHFTIHYYENDGKHRAVTLGLGKLGLPDLSIEDVPANMSAGAQTIIVAIAQRLGEGAPIEQGGKLTVDLAAIRHGAARATALEGTTPSASHKIDVSLQLVEPQEGDAHNRQLGIRFERQPGASETERLASALTALNGWTPDSVVDEKADDAELAAVAARVQAKMPELSSRFRDRKAGERLSVKAPFDSDDQSIEWMWVEVSSWNGTKLHGTLSNEPDHVKKLKIGAPVDVDQRRVADYLWTGIDGKHEGGESAEVLKKRHGG